MWFKIFFCFNRNNALERLDMLFKVSENQRSERESSLMLDKLRFQEDYKLTKFISKKSNFFKLKYQLNINDHN